MTFEEKIRKCKVHAIDERGCCIAFSCRELDEPNYLAANGKFYPNVGPSHHQDFWWLMFPEAQAFLDQLISGNPLPPKPYKRLVPLSQGKEDFWNV